MLHLSCAWQLPRSESEDADVFKAAGATTIAAPPAVTAPVPVPEAVPAPDTAAPDVTAPAPAATAVPAPVPIPSADPALPPAPGAAPAPAHALDAVAPADGDASVTAAAIDTNNANPPQLQLESALPPSQETHQGAELLSDQARRIHINSH